MPIALGEFWTRLVDSGITDAVGCRRIAAEFCDANGGSPPSESVSLAQHLIKSGQITEFQARALLAGRGLRIGSYLIRSRKSPSPLSRWWPATHVGTGSSGFVFQATEDLLAGGRERWLDAHAGVSAPTLQPLELEQLDAGMAVFSELPKGKSLSEWFARRRRLNNRQACEIGIAVGDALAAMHARRLVHGAVRADRIWIGSSGETVLLRDPSGPPPHPGEQQVQSWIDNLESAAGYAAPEFAVAETQCDSSTDIYSLGCLLYRMVTGKMPYVAALPQELVLAHASETPRELAEAVQRGESGDPFFRVVAFAMAKNPAARFDSADQLASALRTTRSLVAEKPPITPASQPKPTTKVAQRPRVQKAMPAVPASPSVAPAIEVATDVPQADSRRVGMPSPAVPPAVAASPMATTPAERPTRLRRRKRKNRAPLILGVLCFPILLLLIALVVGSNRTAPETQSRTPAVSDPIPPVTTQPPARREPAPENARPNAALGYELVDDDRLLWVPPYPASSPQAPLELLPPGPGAIVTTKLSDVVRAPAGQEILQSLSPELNNLIDACVSRAKVPAESIRRCSAALHPGVDGRPQVSLAIELEQPQAIAELSERWNASASRTRSGATIYAGDDFGGDVYFVLPSDIDDQQRASRFAVGSVDRISEVAENEGGGIPLPRALQSLWNRSSEQADLVALVTPNFLFADGRSLLPSVAPELVRPLKAVIMPDAAGVILTADIVDPNVYAEVRLVPSGGVSEPALLQRLRSSIEQWPRWADRFVVDSVPDPSWRLLANRLPFMMRFVSGQTRYGVSDGAAVANVYLPARAASQSALAVLLAMNTRPGAAAVTAASGSPSQPLTISEMLDRKMSVSFDQESLEFAINTIVDEFQRSLPRGSTMPPVRIAYGDLEKLAITQNQQIRDFSKNDQPLRKVLTDLMLGANPDVTATGPRDPKQALVWVVSDAAETPGEQEILVTTRQAAEGVYELPAEFAAAPDGVD